MPRKLIHSLHALAVSFGVFAASLVIGVPAGLNATPNATALQTAPAETVGIAAPVPQSSATKPVATKNRQRRRHARDEMAMPFFSFANTLRRGNRS